MSPQTHTQKEHRVPTIFLPWDLHAIILCNIKVSSTEGISHGQEAGFSCRECTDWRVLVQPSIKVLFFNRAQLLRTDMLGDSTK